MKISPETTRGIIITQKERKLFLRSFCFFNRANQKGFAPILIVGIIAGLILITGGGYLAYMKFNPHKASVAENKNDQEDRINLLQKELDELKKAQSADSSPTPLLTQFPSNLNNRNSISTPGSTSVPNPSATNIISGSEKNSNMITLPSGSIVEVDSTGNIVRIVQNAPTPRATPTPQPTTLTGQQIAALASPSVVLISTSEGNGSGFLINFLNGKFIMTNAHVVRNSSTADAKFTDGTTINATVLGRDEFIDLAILSAVNTNSPVLSLGSSAANNLPVGEDVYALGFPLSISAGLTNLSFTKGTLSARQNVSWYSGTLLQTDAAINHGNSGGPLVNDKGEVVGVNTFGLSGAPDVQGIFFAIPIDTAKQLIPGLLNGLNKTIFYPPAKGSSVTISRSMVVRLDLNQGISCSGFGYTDNDLTLCDLYRNNYRDYKWVIDEEN